MDIVEFLTARITEEECALRHADVCDSPTAGLALRLLAECEQKRAIVNRWVSVSKAEGICSPADSRSGLTAAGGAMLAILASAYRKHPDFPSDWRTPCSHPSTSTWEREETPPR